MGGGWDGDGHWGQQQKEIRPKKKVSRYSLYIIIHKMSSSSGSLILKQRKGVTDRRMGPNQYALSTSSKLGA